MDQENKNCAFSNATVAFSITSITSLNFYGYSLYHLLSYYIVWIEPILKTPSPNYHKAFIISVLFEPISGTVSLVLTPASLSPLKGYIFDDLRELLNELEMENRRDPTLTIALKLPPTNLYGQLDKIFTDTASRDDSSLSSVDAVGCSDDNQVEFRISAYLGGVLAAYVRKWWGGELADEDDGTLREDAEWIVAGYSGDGMVHAWMSVKELAYMVSGKDVDWLPARFAKVGKGKHRMVRIYVGISEQSVLRLRALAHPLRPFIPMLPPRSYYTGL
ncbi:hypothetical protein EDD85DRAFT_943915 [Armillaria nabsnona]|nr:hypothetical protein EDD85DRAFT_943915 [Armillaria nabsnona]